MRKKVLYSDFLQVCYEKKKQGIFVSMLIRPVLPQNVIWNQHKIIN